MRPEDASKARVGADTPVKVSAPTEEAAKMDSGRAGSPGTAAGTAAAGMRSSGGFTLLEVIIAVGILGVSLISLLGAQGDALRATGYARDLTSAAFLAEHKILDIEWQFKEDGWTESDQTYEGDFSEEGWPNFRYECLVDFIELPEYTALLDVKSDIDNESDGMGGGPGGMGMGGGMMGGMGGGMMGGMGGGPGGMGMGGMGGSTDQAFGFLGMAWPMVKAAIESAIRKVNCKVMWKEGNLEHDFEVATFWTHPEAMANTSDFLRNAAMENAQEQGGMPGMGGGMGGPPGMGGGMGGPPGMGGRGRPPGMGGRGRPPGMGGRGRPPAGMGGPRPPGGIQENPGRRRP